MHIFKNATDISQYVSSLKAKGKAVGFVPTMGALHDGHLALAETAISENDACVISIFVNPTQFDEKSDFKRYPRTITKDLALIESIGCQALFLPTETQIYPEESYESPQYDFGELGRVMEAAKRPGHFQGVAQVIRRLLAIIPATRLYLGQKDFQQVKIVTKLVTSTLGLATEVRMCPVTRDTDGLAMSSRNVHLSHEERNDARVLYENLAWAKSQVNRLAPAAIKEQVLERMNLTPTLEDVEYFEIVNAETLQPVEDWKDAPAIVACTAVRFPSARLIDNMYLKGSPY